MSTPPSDLEQPWVLRRELALPNELLHKIILLVLCDSVHSICVSSGETTWERNVTSILYQVSPAFQAISNEISVKAFEIAKDVRHDDIALLRTLHGILGYLHSLAMRYRHPSEWDSNVSFRTIDCSTSPYVFAYALYLSSASLRRNASRSPRDVFESTHKVILSALQQSESLCERVRPKEMTYSLRLDIEEEYELAIHGLTIVQAFKELNNYADSMLVLQPSELADGTGPLAAVRSLIHSSLAKVEGVYKAYCSIQARRRSESDPRVYELPGVLPAISQLAGLTFREDEYGLKGRIQKISDMWIEGCPFLSQVSDRPDTH